MKWNKWFEEKRKEMLAERPATTALFDRCQELLAGMDKDLDKFDKQIKEYCKEEK